MRHFIDEHGIIAWIYDEKTHPLGNENPINIKVVEKKFRIIRKKKK